MTVRRPRLTVAAVAVAMLTLAGCDAVAIDDDADHGDAHDDTAAAHDDHEDDSPPIDGAPELALTAESMTFDPARIELDAGEPVNLAVTSADILHDLVIDEADFHLAVDGGRTGVGGVTLEEPGTYTGYCSVAGHREAGMELEIVVR